MYYIKIFLLYSLIGFVYESTLFKIKHSNKYSGIFYGPITAVYGIGVLVIEILNKYFFKKIKTNKYLKYVIEYIVLVVVLTLIEYIGGNVLKIVFDIDMWNYTKQDMHIGKYICIEYALLWGIAGMIYLYIFKKYTDKILEIFSRKATITCFIIFIFDMLLVLFTKL